MSSEKQLNLFEWSNNHDSPAPTPDSNLDYNLIPTDAQITIPSGTYQTMEQIAAHCNQCHRCELGKNRTHAVIG